MKTLLAAALMGATALSVPATAQTVAPGRTPMAAPATPPQDTTGQATPAPATTPAPAAGQPMAPAVGGTVVDTAGAQVGTITAIDGAVATIDTGTNKVGFPLNSMTPGPNGPIVAVTKAQLDANYQQELAKVQQALATKLAAGTVVRTVDGGAQAGTIKAVDGEFVTLTTASKGDVRLPRGGFSLDAQQNVIIGLTAQQFEAAIAGASSAG